MVEGLMRNNDKVVSDYGWYDGEAKPSQLYLAAPIRDILAELNARSVLDLGCGNGALAHWLRNCGFNVTGCDVDGGGLEIALAGKSGAVFKQVGVYDPPERLGQSGFDAVYSTEVIEHLFSPASLPNFARAVLRPGGHLIVTTPYHGYLKNVLIAMTDKWDSHHTPLWEGGHIKFWSRRTLSALLERDGFEVVGFKGAGRVYGLWKSMILIARVRDGDMANKDGEAPSLK